MGIFNRLTGLAETYVRDLVGRTRTRAYTHSRTHYTDDPDLKAAYAELDAALSRRITGSGFQKPLDERGTGLPPDSLRTDFAVLGVKFGANKEECKKAYRTKMRQYHPDTYNAPGGQQRTLEEQTAVENAATEWTRKTKEAWTHIEAWYSSRAI